MKKAIIIVILFLLTNTLFATRTKVDKAKEAQAKAWVKNQQLEFIENKGQFTNTEGKPADNVLFKASYGNCDIYITNKGLSYVFVKFEDKEKDDDKDEIKDKKPKFGIEKDEDENKVPLYYRLDMDLVGATIDKANIIKEEESKQGHYNYFYPHCPDGIYNVKGYGKITIKNIYKGIDWIIYTNPNNKEHPLKYDFIVHPNADYKDIKIKYLNAQSTSLIEDDTKLKIQTIAGNIEEGNIYSYQKDSTEIKSNYIINKDSTIAFEIKDYDKTQTLIIDPLVWATFYGGSGLDGFWAICVDSKGCIYISGYGTGYDYPIQQLSGAYWQGIPNTGSPTYLYKFDNNGVRLWATYYGGNNAEVGYSLCVDSQDNVYLVGCTYSLIFPTQQLPGAYWQPNNAGGYDSFILKFNELGVRLWATFYGGGNTDIVSSVCVDSQDNLYVIGNTRSSDFPLKQLSGAYWQNTFAGIMDMFIVKFNNLGVREWSTYYGGNDYDYGGTIIADHQDNIYIVGGTASLDFPTQQLSGAFWQSSMAGIFDAVIIKFNNLGVRLWATYYGGTDEDYGSSMCVDSKNNIIIVGYTNSTDFPTQYLSCAYWQANNAGDYDNLILKFNDQGVRLWATYYGGNDEDKSGEGFGSSISIDKKDNIYITGETRSSNIPTKQLDGEFYQSVFTPMGMATYILRFNERCNLDWATYYESNEGGCFGRNVVVDKYNNVFLTGEMKQYGFVTVNPGNGAYYDSSFNGGDDSYILKFVPPVNQNPLSIQTNKDYICINDTAAIILTAIGGSGDTLKWYTGGFGQNCIGKGSPLTIQPPLITTTYYARWESVCDTSICDSITIKVFTIFNTNLNPIICQGETYKVGVHIYTTTGIYIDSLLTNSGCDSVITTNLTVVPLPLIDLGKDSVLCSGKIITLNATYPNAVYLWQDNSTLPIYTATQEGVYWVKVTDTTANCSTTNSITLECYLEPIIPNIFTPNGDGYNDNFVIKNKEDWNINLQVYDRWGVMVYEDNNYQNNWDGKYKGNPLSDGVYYYIINAKGKYSGKEEQYHGSLTILR